jgi:hypothetical protein
MTTKPVTAWVIVRKKSICCGSYYSKRETWRMFLDSKTVGPLTDFECYRIYKLTIQGYRCIKVRIEPVK